MKRYQIFIIGIVAVFIFLLVYLPHFDYVFPYHIDEWHHIGEAMKLQEGEYSGGVTGYRIGFHIFLLLLSKVFNLVLIYKFLPAIWAVFSALVLFYIVYRLAERQFFTALLAMIFFASIKSNVNITGLWFFTPLSFSVPFIFLYVYFFSQGIKEENKKFILSSLVIMVVLLFFHPISVLFSIPFLLIYSLFNLGYLKKEWKFFSLFLIIPLAGALFYKFITNASWQFLVEDLIAGFQFKRGWGVLEIDNSFFEIYSLIGYILAIIGLIFILRSKENLKKYLVYPLWPILVLISILFYRLTNVSYLSPYQRNLYYFVISLPILSALGLNYIFQSAGKKIMEEKEKIFIKALLFIIFVVVIFLTFISYLDIPKQFDLYQVIDNNDYQALLFLSTVEKSIVMAEPGISVAVYPISQHQPVATFFFYGKRKDAEKFFQTSNCQIKEEILDEHKVRYVLSKSQINCGWNLIYDERDYIYQL